jgi:mono/diheme cytochrome c family protein
MITSSKKNKIKNTFFFFVLASVFASCSYDKEELLYSGVVCANPPTQAFYTRDVLPVLQQNCYTCHAAANPPGGVIMGSYADDKSLATSGRLYGAIAHRPGYLPMPFGQAKLSPCIIESIKKWIDDGSPNN